MKNLQKHNLREGLRRMAGTPGWELLEAEGFLAIRSPGPEALGNDLWAAATPANLAKARAFFDGQPFHWLLEEGQDDGCLAAAGAPAPERLPEMVFPLGAGLGRARRRGLVIAKAESEAAFLEWCVVLSESMALDLEVTRRYFEALHRTAGFIPFLARVEDQPAATAMVFPGRTGAGIFAVATLEPFRRQGLGSALVRACLEEARTGPGGWAVLYASSAGRPLYESLGFRTVQVVREYRLPGAD